MYLIKKQSGLSDRDNFDININITVVRWLFTTEMSNDEFSFTATLLKFNIVIIVKR